MNNPINVPANSIFTTYKRKEMGWFIILLIGILASSRWGGALGATFVGSVLAILYKIIKNPVYTNSKKLLLAIVTIVGGLITFFLCIYLFFGGLRLVLGDKPVDALHPNFKESQSRVLVNDIFVGSSTPKVLAPDQVKIGAELEKYYDARHRFSISYPNDWLINDNDLTAVEFGVPSNDEIGVITVSVEPVKGYDLQTYSKAVIYGFLNPEDENTQNLKIISEGNSESNEMPAYQFEFTADYIIGDYILPLRGVYIITIKYDVGYVLFASSLESEWSRYQGIFKESLSSFEFPKQ